MPMTLCAIETNVRGSVTRSHEVAEASVVDARSGEVVVPFELAPVLQNDLLDLIDVQIGAFELQLVLAARDAAAHHRRVLAGIGAVDPQLGPGIRPDS